MDKKANIKIGILSLYFNNYNIGGLLQSYATVNIINSFGYCAEQICYDFSVSNEESIKYQLERRKRLLYTLGIKIALSKFESICSHLFKRKNDLKFNLILEKQNSIFKEFENFIPHSKEVYTINDIDYVNDIYDEFVVGSDQVWNPGLLAHDAMYLRFADSTKRKITYAVSMGKSSLISYESNIFAEKISNFKEIAVREKSLKNLIEHSFDKKCITVLDPTLLLDYSQWKKIENPSIVPGEKYVFCYFLGNCGWQRALVQKFADEYNYLIIDIPYIMGKRRKSDRILKGEKKYDVGPREFISLVKNAEYVFTDSFHAVAFSVNFKTNFYVFDRDGLSGNKSINSRITDFLDMLSLSNRRIISKKSKMKPIPIDYLKAISILEIEIKKSKEWLKKQLSL